MKPRSRRPVLGLTFAAVLGLVVAARAQTDPLGDAALPATADSVAVDSTVVDSVDVDVAGGAVDSLAADSLAVELAPPDSVVADSLAAAERVEDAEPEASQRYVVREGRLRALRPVLVGDDLLAWYRPESLEEAVELLPEASVRVAGDRGMRAWHSLSPIGTRSPEVWIDGIPTRSPGDHDPGLWDRSAVALDGVGSSVSALGPVGGSPHVDLRQRPALVGRTHAFTRFGTTRSETFDRALAVTTAATDRVVRFDFEEWKTEEGYDYSFAPAVVSDPSRGRVKMRRFRLGTDLQFEDARVRFTFGRGRRYARGDELGAGTRERWTGELGVVVDTFGEGVVHTVSAWHLDFHDDDRRLDQDIDASRQGLRWQRRPESAGWGLDLRVERWAMQTEAADTLVRADPSRVVRTAAFVQGDPEATWWPWFRFEVADAEHSSGELGLGGRAGVRRRLGDWDLVVRVERVLRPPTLLETDGWQRLRTLTPEGASFAYQSRVWEWDARRAPDFERQERAGVALRGRVGAWALDVALDRWQLRDGIGWRADAATGRAVVEAGIETEAWQLRGRVARSTRFDLLGGRWTFRLLGQGQWVPDGVDVEASRGVGYPRWHGRTRMGLDREFFSPRNRLGVDVEFAGHGAHRDDGLGPVDTIELPSAWWASARLWLRVRDAEMSLNLDNALDRERDEVLGTVRRGRQLRWQLVWPFFN
jgi:hypothetical protein